MRFQHVPELVQINFIPTHQLSISVYKTGPVVYPVKLWKSFSAIHTILVAIPSH
jgi:hypothetical protein